MEPLPYQSQNRKKFLLKPFDLNTGTTRMGVPVLFLPIGRPNRTTAEEQLRNEYALDVLHIKVPL